MRGLITGRDVVLLAFTIVRLWGLPMYLRCLRAALSRLPGAVEPHRAGGMATFPTIDPGPVIQDAIGV